ncbi:MAG: replication initiation protein, partial [Cetobacterium sp.]
LKHHKDFHGIQLQNFSVKDRNLIFALCYKLMEQENNIIKLGIKEIIKIGNYKPTKAKDNIYKSLEEAYNRIKNASICLKKDNGVKHFVLFTVFETFEDTGIIEIEVNKNYRYLLNEVTAPFTIQNLVEYTKLNSGYSQLTYSILREWDKKKVVEISIDDFRNKIGVPKSYDTSNFNRQVLKPIMNELPEYFENLKLEKIKTGKKISHLKFSWGISKAKLKRPEKLEIEITQSLNDIIEKSKKNRFLKNILTNENIYKLIQIYDEYSLKKGLMYSYKIIQKEIPNFNYLVKVLENGIEEQEIQIKIIEKDTNIFSQKEEKNSGKDILFAAYLNMQDSLKTIILEEAKEMYMKDVNIKKMTPTHENFFKAAEKSYILKILNGVK